MSKITILFLSFFTTLGLSAQNIVLDPATAEVDGDPSIIVDVHIELTNNGTDQTMSWERTVNDIPEDWTSSVCDFNLCWSPAADYPDYFYEAAAGTTGTVYVKFDARNYYDGAFHPVPGCGTVEVVFYSVEDSANYSALAVFHARLGVESSDCETVLVSPLLDNSFSVYPNPAINTLNTVASFSANIKNIEIVNIVGKSVQEIKWNSTNGKMTFDITDLPKGIYFVRLINDKNIAVYTEKISVTQ